jgi:hypothetical protein
MTEGADAWPMSSGLLLCPRPHYELWCEEVGRTSNSFGASLNRFGSSPPYGKDMLDVASGTAHREVGVRDRLAVTPN